MSFSFFRHSSPFFLLCCLLRAFEEEGKARLGVVECAKHELLQPFNVLHEKEGEWNNEGFSDSSSHVLETSWPSPLIFSQSQTVNMRVVIDSPSPDKV